MAREIGSRTGGDSWLRRRPLVVDLVVAAALAAVVLPTSVSLIWISDWQMPGRLAVTAAVVLAHVAVALRRVRVKSAFAVVSLAMLGLVLAPVLGGRAGMQMGSDFVPVLLPSSLTFPVILYAVAAYGRGREPVAGLAVALVGAVITSLRLWGASDLAAGVPTGNVWRLFIFGAMLAAVIAPWALGRFRGVHEAYVSALEEQSRRAGQDQLDEAERATSLERSRIAREMHDVVAHSLSVMVSQAEGGRLATQRDPAIAVPVFTTIAKTGREALTEMRGLLGVLASPDESSELRAPQPALSDLGALIDRVAAAGTAIVLTEHGNRGDLGRSGELAAYRVVQEALTNVVKHAGPAARVTIDLTWTPAGLTVEIGDNGRTAAPASARGRGLAGMRERVELVGGDLHVGPGEDSGYQVTARIPLAEDTTEGMSQ